MHDTGSDRGTAARSSVKHSDAAFFSWFDEYIVLIFTCK
jgi:hypothetical protein